MDIQYALSLARRAVESFVYKKPPPRASGSPAFKEKRGVFVSLYTHPQHELRGCIGYPEPHFPLGEAIVHAAIHACQDPRFEPLKAEELNTIIIEISVLTEPRLLTVEEPEGYRKKIMIGQDGLLVRRGSFSGLLLPQVATEHGLDIHEFLIHTCLKAGLPPTAWMEPETRVYTFQAEIFSEKEPGKA